jgi:hypothetical protein
VTLHKVCELYILFVLIFTLCMFYAHEREILSKMLHFDHVYVTCLYVPIYLVVDTCAPIVAILLVHVSILSSCSALCIFDKHMLAFVDLIHALRTRGRKSTQFMFPGGVLHQGKKNWERCISSRGACIHAFGSSFSPEF